MDHILLIFLPPLYMAEILPISGLNFSFFTRVTSLRVLFNVFEFSWFELNE